MSAPGSYSRMMDHQLLKQLLLNDSAYHEFLDFVSDFNSQPNILGLGAERAGGLLVSAKKI